AVFRATDQIKKDQLKVDPSGRTGQQLARKFVQMFGLAPEFANLSGGGFKSLMEDMKKFGPDPMRLQQGLKDAQALNTELRKTGAIFDSWKTAIQSELLAPVTALVKGLNEVGARANANKAEIPPTSLLGRMLG